MLHIFNSFKKYGFALMPPSRLENITDIRNISNLECPFCRAKTLLVQTQQAQPLRLYDTKQYGNMRVIAYACQGCKGIIVYAQAYMANGQMDAIRIYPQHLVSQFNMDALPPEIMAEYAEIIKVIGISPASALMLIRRLLAYVLVAEFDAPKEYTLYQQIEHAYKHEKCSYVMKDTLHALREAGNFGVHGALEDTGELIPTKPAQAEAILFVLEATLTSVYERPYERQALKEMFKVDGKPITNDKSL